jgi:NADH-quinone oxidoreductase subunit J
MYLLLGAEFIAVLQVIVYAGAIVVLFLFVIMLLRARRGEVAREKLPRQRTAAVVLGGVFAAGLLYAMWPARGAVPRPLPEAFGTAQSVGGTLFSAYLLPFEVASVVLLAGIIAAVVLGRARPVT